MARGRSRRSNGRSGQQVAAELPVVKILGKEASNIASRLGCKLESMNCIPGPRIILDIPGAAIKAVKNMPNLHAKGRTPREVKRDVEAKVNAFLSAQPPPVPATG